MANYLKGTKAERDAKDAIMDQGKVKCIVHRNTGGISAKGKIDNVHIGVNGVCLEVPRGIEVELPTAHFNQLQNTYLTPVTDVNGRVDHYEEQSRFAVSRL